MFGEPRVEANLDDRRRWVADALATFTIEDLRQLVAEIKAPVGLIGAFNESALWRSSANDNQLAWPFIPFPENLLV
jgi:hypothetical protein